MQTEEITGYVKKWGLVAGIALCIYLLFRYLLPLVFPFLLAGIVSVLYYPVLRKMCIRFGIWEKECRKWVIIGAVVLFYVIAFLCILLAGGYLCGQGQSILLNFPFYKAKAVYFVRQCCCQVDDWLQIQRGNSFIEVSGFIDTMWQQSSETMIPKITTYSVQMAGKAFQGVLFVVITVIATFFMINDYDALREQMLQSEMGICFCKTLTKSKETLKAYFKAQVLIMLLDGLICASAFCIIKQPYWIVLGILVAVVDALPVLGAGLILIPYVLYLLVMKHFGMAFVVFLAYLGCLVIRQTIEPRMVGNRIGMKPLYTLISMYAGFQLFGVIGFLLGPVGILLGKEIYNFVKDKKLTKPTDNRK